MQILSLIWGILAFLGMIVAFFPCLGSLNWMNIPFAAVGLIIGIVALTKDDGEAKGMSIAGIALNGAAIFFGIIRLIAGFGVL